MANIYLDLTEQLNAGRLRAIISSGQAVVLHRLAIMSKDGDWILREENGTMAHVLDVLTNRGARYRFGAPLDVRWLSGGWSAHFEFRTPELRVRTDFVTRPPRLGAESLDRLWKGELKTPVLGVTDLAEIKKTNREKDYAVIGELARLMESPREQMLFSRSARDLLQLTQGNPELANELAACRPLLRVAAAAGLARLEEALDSERRDLIHANERGSRVTAKLPKLGARRGRASKRKSAGWRSNRLMRSS